MYVAITLDKASLTWYRTMVLLCSDSRIRSMSIHPLREDNPRITSPWVDEIFYYNQVDLIRKANKGKNWKWCEV